MMHKRSAVPGVMTGGRTVGETKGKIGFQAGSK
jgi:hypothetical protein